MSVCTVYDFNLYVPVCASSYFCRVTSASLQSHVVRMGADTSPRTRTCSKQEGGWGGFAALLLEPKAEWTDPDTLAGIVARYARTNRRWSIKPCVLQDSSPGYRRERAVQRCGRWSCARAHPPCAGRGGRSRRVVRTPAGAHGVINKP